MLNVKLKYLANGSALTDFFSSSTFINNFIDPQISAVVVGHVGTWRPLLNGVFIGGRWKWWVVDGGVAQLCYCWLDQMLM